MISSKLRKDMMDYFFLNDIENLEGYLQQHLFNKLNSLEKILLVHALKDKDTGLVENTLNYFKKLQDTLKVNAEEMDILLSNYLCYMFTWNSPLI